jgi:anaerobic selenocysteine-containing dehydrogenase
MKYAIGVAATTCSYKDWWGTDLIIFFGANPANDQPVTTKYLHEAKKTGAKVVLVHPYLEPGMQKYWVPSSVGSALFGTDIADYWFPVTQGGDIAFLYGVIKILLANGWYDRGFVERHTAGLEDLRRQADTFDFATLEQQSGLPRATMEEFAAMIHGAKNGVLVWSMGITQHAFGADTVQVKVRYGDFTSLTRQISMEEPLTEAKEIYRLGCWLLARERLVNRPLCLIGLGVSGLVEGQASQLRLPFES